MPKKRRPMWDLTPYEEEISAICRDFDRFCDYVLNHKNIVTKKTGSLNRQACFEINGLLSYRQTYEKPTKNQQAYPVIQLFAGVAVVFELLEVDNKGTSMIQGKNWDVYQKASPIQRYVFFWCCAFFSVGEILKLLPDVLLTSQILYAYGKLKTVSDFQAFFRTDQMMFIKKDYGNVRVLLSEFGLWPQSEDDKSPVEFFKLMGEIFLYLNNSAYYGAQFNLSEECYESLMPCVRGMENSPLQEILYRDVPERSQYEGMTVDLKVSLSGYNCSRTLRLNMADTLMALHNAIQRAFEFDDDHLYAFYVKNAYVTQCYMPGEYEDNGEIPAEETYIGQLADKKGAAFRYLFDFGDAWWFDIKAVKITEGHVSEAQVIQRHNDPPAQYGYDGDDGCEQ